MSSIAFSPAQGSAALEGADHPTKFGGMDVSEAKRLKSLQEENAKLKRLLADAMLDNVALKDLLSKKF